MIGSRRGDDHSSEDLREMMLEASGSDRVLQHKEFSRWAGRHTHEVAGWSRRALVHGRDALRDGGLIYGSAYTSSGSQILIAASGDYLFIKDAYLIYVPATSNTSFTIYDANGDKLSSSDSFYVSLRDMLKGQRNYAEAIPQLSGVFTVPQ